MPAGPDLACEIEGKDHGETMNRDREVLSITRAQAALEGAGVRLKRAFGFNQLPNYDPFLLLDDIHSTRPEDYTAGFPWHPHRGIETVTYVISGRVDHGDSLGNAGAIGSGDVQWMTAGSGIVHQEMPERWTGDMRGLQLWVNLPADQKMMGPRYRDIAASSIPEVAAGKGITVKVIAGSFGGLTGPVKDLVRSPDYLDVKLAPSATFHHEVEPGHTVFAYILEGNGVFGAGDGEYSAAEDTVLFGDGSAVKAVSGEEGARFLLISGAPLKEPVAWGGPIVMNTEEELEQAFREYREGTFLKQ
jgi:redox-sensitive bicupin YhaK (pirin superfamily)